MDISASIKCLLVLFACLFILSACGPGRSQNPPATTYPADSDEDYDYPIPADNDGDWYYNYYNLEY